MKTALIMMVIAMSMLMAACSPQPQAAQATEAKMTTDGKSLKTATFAGGCFWCVESDFEKVDGVIDAVSGYAGGPEKNPTYHQVAMGTTGHRESVQVTFDPKKITYEKLLDVFIRHIDPTDAEGQFVDRGHQYSPAIFYQDEDQKAIATKFIKELQASGKFSKPLAVQIIKLNAFYPAEDYHQNYYKKEPWSYKRYRSGSGRDQFIDDTWKKK